MSHNYSILSTLSLKGYPVKGIEGRELGKIQELMLDLEKGHIVYAVLELREEVAGTNVRLLALPWSIFSFDSTTNDLVLDIETERLEDDAPPVTDALQSASYQSHQNQFNRNQFNCDRPGCEQPSRNQSNRNQSNREPQSAEITHQVSWQHVVAHSIMNYSSNAM